MAIDIRGFVTPEQDFRGLYEAANTVERKNYREEEMRFREEEKQNQLEAKRQASGRFFANYLDPKDYFTGTNYDPHTYKTLNDALGQAYDLINKGAGDTEVLAAINPLVNRANKYTQLAKTYTANKNELINGLKQFKGYKIPALSKKLDQTIFFDDNGKMKDLEMIDPDNIQEYLAQTLQKYGGEVTTSAGLDDYLKGIPTFSEEKSVRRKNSRGGVESRRSVITKPAFMDYDEQDENFVPKYEVATEYGVTQEGEFEKPDGTKVKAPIRLLDEKIFYDVLQKRPDVADWVMGEVKRLNPEQNLNTTQADNAARAILYNKIKDAQLGNIKDIQVSEQPKVYNNYNMGGSNTTSNFRDSYNRILKESNNPDRPNKSIPINELASEDADLVVAAANRKAPNAGFDYTNIFVKQDSDGALKIYKATDGTLITSLTEGGVNVDANKPFGVKAKTAAEQAAQKNETEPPKPTGSPKKEIKRSDIPSKAAAAGYSVKEYEQLLKDKGVTIKD